MTPAPFLRRGYAVAYPSHGLGVLYRCCRYTVQMTDASCLVCSVLTTLCRQQPFGLFPVFLRCRLRCATGWGRLDFGLSTALEAAGGYLGGAQRAFYQPRCDPAHSISGPSSSATGGVRGICGVRLISAQPSLRERAKAPPFLSAGIFLGAM